MEFNFHWFDFQSYIKFHLIVWHLWFDVLWMWRAFWVQYFCPNTNNSAKYMSIYCEQTTDLHTVIWFTRMATASLVGRVTVDTRGVHSRKVLPQQLPSIFPLVECFFNGSWPSCPMWFCNWCFILFHGTSLHLPCRWDIIWQGLFSISLCCKYSLYLCLVFLYSFIPTVVQLLWS